MVSLADYDAWKKKQQQANVGAANVVLSATEDKPDQIASDLNIASEYGQKTGNPVPPLPLVKEYRSVFQGEIERLKNSTILSSSPRLAEWLRDPENAGVAKDDLDNLSWFEGFGRGTVNTLSRAGQRVGQMRNQYMFNQAVSRDHDRDLTFGEIVNEERRSSGIVDRQGGPVETWDGSEYLSAIGRWIDVRYAELIGLDDAKAAQGYGAAIKQNIDRIRELPKSHIAREFEKKAIIDDVTLGQAVGNFGSAILTNPVGGLSWALETAGESAPQIVAALATTLATRNSAAGMGVMAGGSYATERFTSPADFLAEKGMDLSNADDVGRILSDPVLLKEANDRGVVRGAIIGAFDLASAGLAGKVLAHNPLVEAVAQGVQQAISGSLGEYSARIAAGQKIDWNEILAEGLAEIATAPVDMGIAGRKLAADRRRAKAAEGTAAQIADISSQSQASVLRSRMPDKFRQFVEQATANGPAENVFIPATEFTQYFQKAGIDPHALVDQLEGVSRDDLDAALAGGGDLQIPVATYAAKIAGSEHDAFLMENMRFDPNEFTSREAAKFNARAQDAIEETWQVAEQLRQQDEELRSFEQEIYDTMVSRLREAGRATDVATTEAMLYPAFYRVMAERSGLTTEEFMQRYPLPGVRGSLPQGMQFRDVDALTRTLAEARARKTVRDKRQTLLEFIDDYGGINDVGGELTSLDAVTVNRGTGKKSLRLARKGFVSGARDMFGGSDGKRHGADDVARAAIERGFMANDPIVSEYRRALDDGREAPDVTRALWDAIDRELHGEAQYSGQDAIDPAIERAAALDDVEQHLSTLGVSLADDDATIRQALKQADARTYSQQQSALGDALRSLIELAKSSVRSVARKLTIAPVSPELAATLKDVAGLDVGGYRHNIDADAIRHIFKQHGNEEKEIARGQLPITEADIQTIPEILTSADYLVTGAKNPRKQDIVGYIKEMPDGTTLYMEEVRAGRKTLSALSMRKYPAARDADSIAETLLSNARSDGGDATKVTPFPKSDNALYQEAGRARGLIQFPASGVGNGETIIRLFEAANLSTMLHESGHYFLTVMQDLAARGEQQAVADMAAVREWWRANAADVAKDAKRSAKIEVTTDDVSAWLGNGVTGDAAKDRAIKIGAQEQFARGFEAYLMEGRAPNAELRSAFEKFRAWLISIYRKLSGLDVKISDDIRRVFDRMLATDEEIAKAQSDVGGTSPVFATAEQMGLTADEYANLMKLRSQSEEAAKARLLRETMAPIKREKEKWFREERVSVRSEAEAQVNAYPYFRAIEWMGNKRWLGEGGLDADMSEMRLSKQILVERYGEGVLKTLPRGKQTVYTVDGGVDPDEAAGWFGFDSGDEMVQAMERAPRRTDAIDAETDRIMRERHGDALNDGSIEAHAMDAVHVDKRGQWIAAELKAVAEVAGLDVALTAKEARLSARQTIARMRVRDASSANRFLAAERRAGEEAARLGAMLARESVWLQNANRRVEAKARAAAQGKVSPDTIAAAIERRNAIIESADHTHTVADRTVTRKDGPTKTIAGGERTTHVSGYNELVNKLIDAKRRQLINHALYSEARRVTEEVEQAEAYVAKLGKKSTRERIAGAGRRENASIDYLGAIDEILERYDFRKISGRAEQRRGSLNSFVEAMKASGRENELAIPETVLADAARKPYKTLPVEHLRGVIDSLKNLEHVATRWDKLIDGQQQRALDEVVTDVTAAFDANMPKRPPGRVRTKAEAVRHAGRQFLDLVLNAGTILREIDGFKDAGAAYRNIKAPIDDAMSRLIVRKQDAAKALEQLYSVYSKAERREMAVRQHIPELGYALSKWERIAVALNTGNSGNVQRLTDPKVRGSFTEAQIRAILGTLDARDADFVQSVWDYVGSFRNDISAREKRTTGVEPEWVEATPIDIAGKTLRGGYYPIKYDPRLSSLARDDETQGIAQSLQAGRFGKAQTRNGHLKDRAQSSGRDIDLDMSVLHRHINQVIYDIELSEPVANSWRIIQNGRVRSAFIDAGRQADFDALETWLKDVGDGELRSADLVGRASRVLKSNFTAAKLAFNLVTVASQITGLSQSMVVLGNKRDFARGVQASFRPGAAADIAAKSPYMSTRATTFNKDIYDFYNDPQTGPTASRWGEIKSEIIGPASFWLMTKVQWHLVDVPTWLGGYDQGMRRFGNDEAKAIAHADSIVKRAQASGLFSDRSAIERGSRSSTKRQEDWVRLFTALGSYMFAKFNVAYERTGQASRAIRQEGISAKSAAEVLSWTLDMAFLFMLEAVVMAAIRGKLPGGDDDEDDGWAKFLAKETALGVMGTIPFVRDGASALQGFDGGGAYGGIVGDAAKGARGLFNVLTSPFASEEIKGGDIKGIINATGLATGLPATQINRAVDAAWRDAEGGEVSPLEYILGKRGR